MAGFSGVQRLNAVVWEVEDLCPTLLLDGPNAGVMGYRLGAGGLISLFISLFYFTSAGCKNRQYVIDRAHLVAVLQPWGVGAEGGMTTLPSNSVLCF